MYAKGLLILRKHTKIPCLFQITRKIELAMNAKSHVEAESLGTKVGRGRINRIVSFHEEHKKKEVMVG